jgi:glycosyltransferase involved in cell wall biosynthesis
MRQSRLFQQAFVMRIAVVDYPGHAFPVQLSRALAGAGHQVLHVYFQDFQSPHGKLEKTRSDPDNLTIDPVSLGKAFPKYSFVRRRFYEVAAGKAFAGRIEAFRADVVLLGNSPLDCAWQISKRAREAGRKVIFWQQDIYSSAIARILGRRMGALGKIIGKYYHFIEKQIIATSNATVVISQDFVDLIRTDFGLSTANVHVVENWAPLEDIPTRPKNNNWSLGRQLADKKVVLYSGTIGLKHDPKQLLELARALQDDPQVRVVVASEGPFADWLACSARNEMIDNLVVLPFQPYEDLPDMLGCADVMVAILEPDAGAFSVPSKILSYLCAGRAIVLSAPAENLAARTITKAGAGVAVAAGDQAAFMGAVRRLLGDDSARSAAGKKGRAYAETAFDIARITNRFEAIFQGVSSPAPILSAARAAPTPMRSAKISF